LSEYGLHIARELQQNAFVNLVILADDLPTATAGSASELPGYSVIRCWSPDRRNSAMRLLSALREQDPDVVWFNLLFSTFGTKPTTAFAGLTIPLLTRLSGRYTHVTLHHLMDTVDLEDLGVRFPRAYRWAGAVATRMLLLSNSVSVLMPRYREILASKYGRDNVHVRAHGILSRRPEYPDFSRRGQPHRILAFGKWGTYKRLELMIEAFDLISAEMPTVKLVVAGGDHPQAAGYVESVRRNCEGNSKIEFTGYVHEDRLRDLFQSSSVAVMPYSSSTGCSGVAHLACGYGVPIVCADLEDFRQMAIGEDLAIDFYQPGNAESLARCLIQLLESPERLRTMAEQNFSSALRMTMPSIVQKYLRHFELDQRLEALRHVSRFNRLPKWLPSRSLLLRAIRRNSENRINGSAAFGSLNRAEALFSQARFPATLGNGNGNGGGKLGRSRSPHDFDGVGGSRGIRVSSGRTSAGSQYQSPSNGHEDYENASDMPAPEWADERQSDDSKRHDPTSENPTASASLLQIRPSAGSGNSKGGIDAARAGSNGSRGKAAAQDTGEIGASKRDGRGEGPGLSGGRDREAS